MESLDILLSDKYIQFTQFVAQAATKKKQLKADFKEVYDKFQADTKALDQEILDAQADFEAWKHEFQTNVGDG